MHPILEVATPGGRNLERENLTRRGTHGRGNRLAAQRDRTRRTQVAQSSPHPLETLEAVDLEAETRVNDAASRKVVGEVRLVEGDRLNDAGPGGERRL